MESEPLPLPLRELDPHRRSLLQRLWPWLLAAGCLGAVLWSARPLAREVRGWQARRLAVEAADLLARGQERAALNLAASATQLRWSEPEPRRLVARAAEQAGEWAVAARFWRELAADDLPLSPADRLSWVRACLALRDAASARREFARLPTAEAVESSDHLLTRALLAHFENRVPEAIAAARGVLQAPDAAPSERLRAAALLGDLTGGEDWPLALWTMQQLSREPTRWGRQALVWQATHARARLDPSRATDPQLAAALRQHADLPAEVQLLTWDLELNGAPERAEQIFAAAEARFGSERSYSELALLAAWLQRRGAAARVLTLLPSRVAAATPDLLQARLHALAQLGRWDDLVRELRLVPTDGLPIFTRETLLAVALTRRGEPAGAELHWRKARDAAAGQIPQLLALAHQAEKHGAFAAAESALRNATDLDPRSRSAQDAFLQFLGRRADLPRLRERVRTARRFWPADAALQSMELYLAALANESGALLAEEAERVIQASPPAERLAGPALLWIRRGESARALALLPSEAGTGEPLALQLVRAAALQGAGFAREARENLARVPRSELQFAEERALFDRIFQGS